MLIQVAVAAIVMLLTTAVHAGGMVVAMRAIRSHEKHTELRSRRHPVLSIGAIILLMFFVALVQVSIWASIYLALGAIQDAERAIYFSMVTFTTLGYGDVLLDEHWRVLASFEAANGIIMFGWTTAIVIAAVQRIYLSEKRQLDHK